MASHRFGVSPMAYGFSVDSDRFRYFSDLTTIIHYESRSPGSSKTYAFAEMSRGGTEVAEQAWYVVPSHVWKLISTNLAEARSRVADLGSPILALNRSIVAVQQKYLTWFNSKGAAKTYQAIHPILGHHSRRCVDALLSEIGRTPRTGKVRYLDIGCGDGEITSMVTNYLNAQGEVLTVCIDPSLSQMALAKKSLRKVAKREFHEERLETWTTTHSFELITAIHSLYTVDESFTRKIYEMLAPGGIACIWLASENDNVVTSICNAVDSALRPGQLRITAERVSAHARAIGIQVHDSRKESRIPALLDRKGQPTMQAESLIEFCALQTLTRKSHAWTSAIEAIKALTDGDGQHPLTDRLLVFQRPL